MLHRGPPGQIGLDSDDLTSLFRSFWGFLHAILTAKPDFLTLLWILHSSSSSMYGKHKKPSSPLSRLTFFLIYYSAFYIFDVDEKVNFFYLSNYIQYVPRSST